MGDIPQRRLQTILHHLSGHASSSSSALDSSPCAGQVFSYNSDSGDVLSKLHPTSGCLHITLNRPAALNAICVPMMLRISALLKEASFDDNVKYVVITGAGGKAFGAGGDIRSLYNWTEWKKKTAAAKAQYESDLNAWKASSNRSNTLSPLCPSLRMSDADAERITMRHTVQFFDAEYNLNRRVSRFNKPYIAILDGIVMGGGCGVSVHGSFRVVSEKTVMAMPEAGIGLFPDVGGTHFLVRTHPTPAIGMMLGLTGGRITGKDAVYSGLGTHFVPSARIPELQSALLNGQHHGEDSWKHIEHVLDSFSAKEINNCTATVEPNLKRIEHYYGDRHATVNSIVGLIQATASNDSHPDSVWCKEQLALLQKKSPSSLKITFRQMHQGRNLDIESVLKMEYRLANRLVGEGDEFREGVRATIIDKDQKPKWNPATLEEVDDAEIDRLFSEWDKEYTVDLP